MLDILKDKIEIVQLMNKYNLSFKPEFNQELEKVENNEINTNNIKLYNSEFNELIFKLIELK
jgi:hypothetical protein